MKPNQPRNVFFFLPFCLAWIAGMPAVARSAAPDAALIMKKCDEMKKIAGLTAKATLTVGIEGGVAKVKTFSWSRKLLADGEHYNTMTRFHSPVEIRGEGILFLERSGGHNDVFIYLPAYRKVRRIESDSQSMSFMGSNFSYSDFSPPHAEEFRHRFLREEGCPAEGHARCFVIESVPVSEETRARTGYSKSVQWIGNERFLPVHGEYYGPDGKLIKKMDARELKIIDSKSGKWMAHLVRLEEASSKRYTELSFAEVRVDPALSDAIFSQQNLMKE